MDEATIITENDDEDGKPPSNFRSLPHENKEDPLISLSCSRESHQKVVVLHCYNDWVVNSSEESLTYCAFSDDLYFGYDNEKLKIWFGNKENHANDTFVTENETIFKTFVEYLKVRCSQTNFSENFELVEEKGKGKKSSVFTVKKIRDNTIFAVKIQQYTSKFQEEIQILRELQHPNVIYFREYFIENGNVYIVMDFEDGGSLLDLIQLEVQLSPKEKIKIITDLLNGLEFLRIKGIVHRDLKPENILYSRKDGNYKIADFGISKREGEKLGKIAGTPGYIAPELLKEDLKECCADQKSDIYSMGLIFYEIITFKQYYSGKNSEEILTKNMEKTSLKKREKENNGFEITSMEYSLLEKMIRSEPTKRKSSFEILKSDLFRKINKSYNMDILSSTTGSPSKSNCSGDDELGNEINLMESFWKMMRGRSWSN